jgi:chlorite dismutase
LPPVPLNLDGWALLHQLFRIRWPEWRTAAQRDRDNAAAELRQFVAAAEQRGEDGSAAFSVLGHKADLMLVHQRSDFAALQQAELDLAQTEVFRFLEPVSSYVSVVELGLYGATSKVYRELIEAGHAPGSPEWKAGIAAELTKQAEAGRPRTHAAIPPFKYVCFYPMDKKRDGDDNWYRLTLEERAALMREHGMIGRTYAGRVKQVISGSIGFDDWEWAVDLYSNDPLVFKELVYEMRFDAASARYGRFGAFVLGLRCPADQLPALLDGKAPAYDAPDMPAPRGPKHHPS